MGRPSGAVTAALAAAGAAVLGLGGPAQADDPCGQAYRPYAAMLLDRLVIGTEALAKRVEAGDLPGARRAWAEARVGWARGEPFLVEYFPDAAAAIDGGPDAGSGFAAVERILFEQEDLAAAREPTRTLVGQAVTLQRRLATIELEAPQLIEGMVEVTSAIGRANTGGEPSLAGASLIDLRNNLQGVETLYALSFADMIRRHRPVLHARIVASLIALDSALHAPIAQLETSTMLTPAKQLSDDFQEVALVLEMEGTGPASED